MRKILCTIALAIGIVGATALPAFAHHNTITGSAVCNKQTGQYDVTWQVENSEYQTTHALETITASNRSVVPVGTQFSSHYLGASESVAGNTSSLTLSLSARWSNGVTNSNSGSATGFSEEGCAADVVAPRARFFGPCGDPMYFPGFDNHRSTKAVTFEVTFFDPNHGWTTGFQTVQGGERSDLSMRIHVLGGTRMTIRAEGVGVLKRKIAFKGGGGACPPGGYQWPPLVGK